MSSVSPVPRGRSPDLKAAIAFHKYIAKKDRYIPVQGPSERGHPTPLAPRRKKIGVLPHWNVDDNCWKTAEEKEVVLKDDIFTTIVSEIRGSGISDWYATWEAIKKKHDGILQEDVKEACRQWNDKDLSRSEIGNGARRAVMPGPSSTRMTTSLQDQVSSPEPTCTRANTPQPQLHTPQQVAQTSTTTMPLRAKSPQQVAQCILAPTPQPSDQGIPTPEPSDQQMGVDDHSTASTDDTSRRQRHPAQTTSNPIDRVRDSRVSKSVSRGRQHDGRARSRGLTADTNRKTTAVDKKLAELLEMLRKEASQADTVVKEAAAAAEEAENAVEQAMSVTQEATRNAIHTKKLAVETKEEAMKISEQVQSSSNLFDDVS